MAKKKSSKALRRHGLEDAIALLEADHEKLRRLVSELAETTSRAVKKREQVLAELAHEIRTHARIEEEIFYPAFHEAAEVKEDEKLFHEAAVEHELVDVVLPKLEDSDPASELFSAKAKVLKTLVEHHAEEEETEMFPRARELLSRERLLELGAGIEGLRAELDGAEVTALERAGKRKRGGKRRGASILSRMSEAAFE